MAVALSVIIPVYNVERFLEQALASLSLNDEMPYEVLLINDGSTDGSPDICRGFAAHHPQVIVIDQPNKGYGAACNAGLDRACGEYVAIFEPDDILGEGFYATLLQAVEYSKPDIVRYNGFHTFSQGVYGTKSANFTSCCGRVLGKEGIPSLWTSHPCIWNGIYRRQMLKDAQARFTEGPGASFQDAQFLISLYYSCSSVLFVDAARYYYRHHANQSVNNADSKVDAILTNMKQQWAWFQSRQLDDAAYMIYNLFNQFRALYSNRLRTSEAKRKLRAGFCELKRVYGINRLTYPEATRRMRILYRLLPVYDLALCYFRWEDRAESLVRKCKSKWRLLYTRLTSNPDKNSNSGPESALLFEDAIKNGLTAQPAPALNSSLLWNEVLPRLNRFLVTEETPVPLEALLPHGSFVTGIDQSAAISFPANPEALILWNKTPRNAASISLIEHAARHKLPVIFADEGPLSSIVPGTGERNSTGVKSPLSFLLDSRGSYLDATRSSMLEELLNSDRELSPEEYRRASALMQQIISGFSGEAGHQWPYLNSPLSNRESNVLVVGQLGDGIPIMDAPDTFIAMLEAAIAENPHANIIVAMHSDGEQGDQARNSKRRGYLSQFAKRSNVTCMTTATNLWPFIGASEKIYVCSSPMGFAALMAKKPTIIYGAPFYAGWGIGEVRNRGSFLQRRQKKRSIEEIFYLTCIETTRYVNPHSMRPCGIEKFLQSLGSSE